MDTKSYTLELLHNMFNCEYCLIRYSYAKCCAFLFIVVKSECLTLDANCMLLVF